MKILMRQFAGTNHSWAVVCWGIAEALKQLGHDVHIFSTDGIKCLPDSLKSNLIGYTELNHPTTIGKQPDDKYDAQISYTCMKNFPHYLSYGNKNRFGIWCYEWNSVNSLPSGFAKFYKNCDKLCAPSEFAKTVFLNSGIPDAAIKVIPHGINSDLYSKDTVIDLPTKKKFKILANIAQNHLRKNIPGLLEAYGKAFTNKDDVCLILKGKVKQASQQFEVSLPDILNNFKNKYPNHGEIKIFDKFLDDVSELYRSVDCTFTMSHCEGFYFPGLESIASGKIAIAPNYGGQLDFLNENNSLLISGKEVRANPISMYWENKQNSVWFEPSTDDAAEKLKFAYSNFNKLNDVVQSQRSTILNEYSWLSITKQFLDLCD
jgi:glycosyltransferase involved in cell wall biosynthesis